MTPDGVSGIDAALSSGGRIEGTVTGPGGQAVQFSAVAAIPNGGGYTFGGASSDASGNYSILVPAGQYRVYSSGGAGQIAEYYDDAADLASADLVQVTAQQTTSGIDFQHAASGHITGRVTDSVSGLGIEGAHVTAYLTDGTPVSSTSTDIAGNYNIGANLRTGQYKVGFEGPDREFDGSPGYVDVFYSDKATIGAANAVSVTAGSTTPGIDQELVPCDQVGPTTTTTTVETTTTTLGGGSCGDPVALTVGRSGGELPSSVSATDGLFVLRASIGLETCAECLCNVNGVSGVTATDALYVLNLAVGQQLPLLCPPC